MVTPQGGECFQACIPALKRLIGDKSSDVRKAVYTLVSECLRSFCYADLKKHEAVMVLILLSGLGDGKESLKGFVEEQFEVCGRSRWELAVKMGAGTEMEDE